MEVLLDSWSLVVILLSAFVIGWAAETAQTFMSRALALSILAWLQTLPEFAVEATIAWHQQRDLMIANLTGSLRLIVGLGLPMIFFVHFFFQGFRKKKFIREIILDDSDFLSVLTLFVSILYFVVIWAKGSLSVWDAGVLISIYAGYLWLMRSLPMVSAEVIEDLPWIGQKLMHWSLRPRIFGVCALFLLGGTALFFSVHPFIHTLEKWSLRFGVSTFVFVQWVAPFLSEFPEKVSAFNWARQKSKAPMAVMNMVGSNINQWTMLAAMIPLVYNFSLGRLEPVTFDRLHSSELLLTIAQSFLAGMLLLDLRFSLFDASLIFILWFVQFVHAPFREEVTWVYLMWILVEVARGVFNFINKKQVPVTLSLARKHFGTQK